MPPIMHIRQGDVLVQAIPVLPSGLARKPVDGGRLVLAYGEVTGHAHAIDATLGELFEDRDGMLYLRLDAPAELCHEEHAAITLAPGTYRISHQREYAPEAIRRVAD